MYIKKATTLGAFMSLQQITSLGVHLKPPHISNHDVNVVSSSDNDNNNVDSSSSLPSSQHPPPPSHRRFSSSSFAIRPLLPNNTRTVRDHGQGSSVVEPINRCYYPLCRGSSNLWVVYLIGRHGGKSSSVLAA